MNLPRFEIASALLEARLREAIGEYGFDRILVLSIRKGAGRSVCTDILGSLDVSLETPPPLVGSESLPAWLKGNPKSRKTAALLVVRKRHTTAEEIRALLTLCQAHELTVVGTVWNTYSPGPVAVFKERVKRLFRRSNDDA